MMERQIHTILLGDTVHLIHAVNNSTSIAYRTDMDCLLSVASFLSFRCNVETVAFNSLQSFLIDYWISAIESRGILSVKLLHLSHLAPLW